MKYKCDYELVKGYKTDSGFDVRCSYDFTLKENARINEYY